MHPIHTIGYEGTTPDDLIATLKHAGVTRLIDIRDLPLSRRPGFSKSALSVHLEAAGIAYIHLRPLGNPNRHSKGDWRELYREHLNTQAAQHALQQAADLCQRERCTLLCYERDHTDCHRQLTSEALSERTGQNVVRLVVRKDARTGSCLGCDA